MPATPAARERAMTFHEVIMQAISGKVSWIEAADILGIAPRTLRRWRVRYRLHGIDGLTDRRRTTRSPRRVTARELKRWSQLYRTTYAGFNARHFHSRLKREHGCTWSYSVVLRALQEAGLLKKKKPRGRHFMRREPRACFGELLHIDGSRHRWLTLCPDLWLCLIVVVDDATRRLLYARFVEQESTHAVLTALAAVLQRFGIPQALYSDRASWAAYTPRAKEPVDRSVRTQVQRALEHLGIEQILAYSPQARGRSERANRTLQERLVKQLAQKGIRSVELANRYLEQSYLEDYNDEFSRPAAHPDTAFVPLGTTDLDTVLCHQEVRTVHRDNTVTLEGVHLQIARQPGRVSCSGLQVQVRRHLDGTHTIVWGKKLLGRYSAQGRALSREALVHPASHAPGGEAA